MTNGIKIETYLADDYDHDEWLGRGFIDVTLPDGHIVRTFWEDVADYEYEGRFREIQETVVIDPDGNQLTTSESP